MLELLVVVQLACVDTYPGERRPLDWSYRTVDGKKCWYQGPKMMPKSNLKWVIEEPVPMTVPPIEETNQFDLRFKGLKY
jgi:hypothetical protein